MLIEGERSALHTSKFRESELIEDFLSVVKLLELNKGVVEVLEQWSKDVSVKMSLPLDGDHARTNLVFKELRELNVGRRLGKICEVDCSGSVLSSDEHSVVIVVAGC